MAAELVAIDADGEHVASYGAERSLKIWDTLTGDLKQEYVPSSHLSSACTCLSWMPRQHIDQKNRRKKMKTEKTVALGTESGNILIYSVSLGDLQTQLSGGHSDSVSAIEWNMTNKELISCSRDGLIIQWDLYERKPKSKWRVDRRGKLGCMALSSDGQCLLTAGKKITLWDIKTQKSVKKFTGHTTDVIQLKLITFADQPDNDYVVSAAAGERHLSVWSLNRKSPDPLVTLNLSDEPIMFDVLVPASKTEKVVICAVTKTGILQLFEQQLNGRSKKSKKSQSTLRVVTDAAQPMPIRTCLLASTNLTIAYDNSCKLCCEIVELSSLQEDVCLVRSTGQAQEDTSHSKLKVKAPDTKHSKKSLSSTSLAPNLPTQDLVRVEKRKSTKELNVTQLPMDKRLGALRLDVQPGEDSKISSENVVHLLMQGLHSNDETILNQVFAVRKVDAIEKTVRRLPIEIVLPVIKELQRRIHKRWNATHLLAWVKFILVTHASYLTTCSELHSILNPIYQVMDVKINLLKKMCNLKGKMDLIVTRVEQRDESHIQQSAIYSFQDDSSDESDIEDGLQQDIEDEEDENDLDQLSGSDNEQEAAMSEDGDESMHEDDSESSESS